MSNALRWLAQLRAGDAVREPFARVRVSAIDPYDIAAVAAEAFSAQAQWGRIYRLTGPESLLPSEQVRVLGAVLERDLRFLAQSDAEARAEMSRAMPAEYVDAFFSYFVDGTYDDSAVLPAVEELTGRTPRKFEQWATAHAAAFR
jgi:uncharacterized protein YbjT (DUF2867 family)